MKLTEKIIWSCVLTIALIFSLGGSYLIVQNHLYLLNERISQNIDQHLVLAYSLESKLIQDTSSITTNYGEDDAVMNDKAVYYLQQLSSTGNQPSKLYTLYDLHDQQLSSTMSSDMITVCEHSDDTYTIKYQDSSYIMYITSSISSDYQHTYRLCNAYDVTAIYSQRNIQFRDYLIIDLLMLTIAFFIIRYLSKRLTKPINVLNDITQHITQGYYEERTNIGGHDEIAQLSKSFDEMAEATQITIEQLKFSNEAKETFMSSFSHEIKTPMTAIIGFADMLRSYDCDKETIQKATSFIYHEGKRLEGLSQHMMELLSLNNKNIEYNAVSSASLKEQLKRYYEALHITNLNFNIEAATIKGNETLLYTLLKNIIDNACKACPQKEIEIQGYRIPPNDFKFQVLDQGIGMNEQEIQKACEPFYMADASRTRTQGGAGLGLSICKRICDLHHTKLWITSKPTQGTSIYFSLEVYMDEK